MKKYTILLTLLALLLAGCTPAVKTVDFAPAAENRLVIYTSHKEAVYRPLIREFEERTGIWVEVVTGGTSELLEQIAKEQDEPRADVMFGGGVESLHAYRQYFQPVTCPDSVPMGTDLPLAEEPWVPFSALPVVLVYNTKLVSPNVITGWQDLQRPEFSGKIAFADPSRSGSSFTALVTGVQAIDDAGMRRVAYNLRGNQLSSSGEVLSAVEDGSCLVGITLEETAMQRIAAGANLAMIYPREGTSCVPDGTAVILGAPHGENALRFLEFTLSAEVQTMLDSQFYRRPVRTDVTISEALIPMAEINVLDYAFQWASEHREEILTIWNEAVEEGGK